MFNSTSSSHHFLQPVVFLSLWILPYTTMYYSSLSVCFREAWNQRQTQTKVHYCWNTTNTFQATEESMYIKIANGRLHTVVPQFIHVTNVLTTARLVWHDHGQHLTVFLNQCTVTSTIPCYHWLLRASTYHLPTKPLCIIKNWATTFNRCWFVEPFQWTHRFSKCKWALLWLKVFGLNHSH